MPLTCMRLTNIIEIPDIRVTFRGIKSGILPMLRDRE